MSTLTPAEEKVLGMLTTNPAAGATYPLPPKPAWATGSRLGDAELDHWRTVGEFADCNELNEDGEPGALHGVQVQRRDELDTNCLTVGVTYVSVADMALTRAEARKLAGLLIEAAACAEGIWLDIPAGLTPEQVESVVVAGRAAALAKVSEFVEASSAEQSS